MKFIVFWSSGSPSRSYLRDLKRVIEDYVGRGFIVLAANIPNKLHSGVEMDVKMEISSGLGVFGDFEDFQCEKVFGAFDEYSDEPSGGFIENCLGAIKKWFGDLTVPTQFSPSTGNWYSPLSCGILEAPPHISFTVGGQRFLFADVVPSHFVPEQICFVKEIAGEDPAIIMSRWGVDADQDISADDFEVAFSTEEVSDVSNGPAYELKLRKACAEPCEEPDAKPSTSWWSWSGTKKED